MWGPKAKKNPLTSVSNTLATADATEKIPTMDNDVRLARKTLSSDREKKAKMLSPNKGQE